VAFRNQIPKSWRAPLADAVSDPSFAKLESFVDAQYQEHTVYPPREDIFNALAWTPYPEVKALILGQDPYHGAGQAHGLCFSVRPDIKIPPSLRNMYKELKTDLDIDAPDHGYLETWAHQGILLLNAVLTVREAEPNSHKNQGWEAFTDAVIAAVNAHDEHVVFVLWGGYARKKKKLIDTSRHTVIESGHPSPLSQKHFMGTKPFSKVNAALDEHGREPIDWAIPAV
jgi:uracil-DNA glycosylase